MADAGGQPHRGRHRPPERMIPVVTMHGGHGERPAGEFRFRPAAYGVAARDGRVLLGRSAFSGRWDIPGGAVEPWELLPEGLKREFLEETGIEVEVGPLLHFTESYFAIFAHAFHSLRFYYRVTLVGDAEPTPQREEITHLQWMRLEDIQPAEFAPGEWEALQKGARL